MREHLGNAITTIKGALPGLTVGTGGVTFPWWGQVIEWATGLNTLLVSVGGLLVLTLTIRKLLLDIRVAQRHLNKEP